MEEATIKEVPIEMIDPAPIRAVAPSKKVILFLYRQ
jgi:hypothetical protein